MTLTQLSGKSSDGESSFAKVIPRDVLTDSSGAGTHFIFSFDQHVIQCRVTVLVVKIYLEKRCVAIGYWSLLARILLFCFAVHDKCDLRSLIKIILSLYVITFRK